MVEALREYMGHEKSTFEQLTALRERASAPGASADERMALAQRMSGMPRGLIVRAEAYPELKASGTDNSAVRTAAVSRALCYS